MPFRKAWKNYFCRRLEGHRRKEQDPQLDPFVRVRYQPYHTDPRIRIRTKKTRIRNAGLVRDATRLDPSSLSTNTGIWTRFIGKRLKIGRKLNLFWLAVIENDLFGMTVVVTMLRKRPTEGSMSSGLMTSSSSLKVIFTFRLFFGKVSSLDIPIISCILFICSFKFEFFKFLDVLTNS